MGPSALRELYLQDNLVLFLTSDTFKGIPRLEILHLEGNPRLEVHMGAFKHLPYLKELNLSGSKLNLYPDAFHGLYNLVHLELREGKFLGIYEKTFHDLEKLKVLYLDSNDMEQLTLRPTIGWEWRWAMGDVGPPLFTRLKSLEVLSVNNNKVKKLTAGVFTGLESLRILRINNNSISSVEKHSLDCIN